MAKVESQNQRLFWDREAPTARFSHPLNRDWLTDVVHRDSAILDYGCGYGRTLAELQALGYKNLTGLDISRGMLDRAGALGVDARLIHSVAPTSPLAGASFDLVLLFAVLTSIPEDAGQRALIADVFRLLRPGGHLYVSDMPLQTDARRMARYRDARPDGSPYGTFVLEDGRAIMRHHPETWFDQLLGGWHRVDRRTLEVDTMRGRTATTVQYLLRKQGD